jgi:hypothetical protein
MDIGIEPSNGEQTSQGYFSKQFQLGWGLFLDKCLREISKLCNDSYDFVDGNTLLVIQKAYESRKTLMV